MTTAISDEQKKIATQALIALGTFDADVRRWFHLIKSRFFTIAWKHLDERDYLGLPEKLADSGAELLTLLNEFVDDPAINQSTLAEVIEYCVGCKERQLSDSPQMTRFFLPALNILESDLRSLSGGANTTVATSATDPDEVPPALSPRDALVVRTMARFDGTLLLGAKTIASEMDPSQRLSDRTILPIVSRLIELGLAERPNGEHSGARLKMKGRRLAQKIAD